MLYTLRLPHLSFNIEHLFLMYEYIKLNYIGTTKLTWISLISEVPNFMRVKIKYGKNNADLKNESISLFALTRWFSLFNIHMFYI